jgi:hypothetical protein
MPSITGRARLTTCDEEEFEDQVTRGIVAPVLALGYADRPVLGRLVVASAMLTRSYPSHDLIRPTVLVSTENAEPNTKQAYLARGCAILAVPEDRLP